MTISAKLSARWLPQRAGIVLAFFAITAAAQSGYRVAPLPGEVTRDPAVYGPYNVKVLPGGVGLTKPLVDNDSVATALSAWTLSGWVNSTTPAATQLIAGIGEASDQDSRYLGTLDGKLMLRMGDQNLLLSQAPLQPDAWHFVAATFDGTRTSLYLDGKRVAQSAAGPAGVVMGRVRPLLEFAPAFPNRVAPTVQLGSAYPQSYGPSQDSFPDLYFPPNPLGPAAKHFGGTLAGFKLSRTALSEDELSKLQSAPPAFAALTFEEASKPWPFQTRNQAGYRAPQDPSTLPHSAAPFSAPVSVPASSTTKLEPAGDHAWLVRGGWMLAASPKVSATPAVPLAARLFKRRLDGSHRPRHCVDHHDRSRHLSRPVLRPQQYGHS